MQIKCEYCGSMIPDDVEKCPNCGATNTNMHRAASGTPKTIAELEQWYKDRGLPPYEVTRFFIGIDCKEPKAFGIYKDGENFIVYKNKSNGERAVRYRGTDEDYAVNELFLKLKEQILKQKSANASRRARQSGNSTQRSGSGRSRRSGSKRIITLVVIFFVIGCIAYSIIGKQGASYYSYNGIPYVFYNDNYYMYDYGSNDYEMINDNDVPSDLWNSSSTYEVNSSDSSVPQFSDDSSWSNSSYFDSDDNDSYNWDSNDSWFSWDSDDSWSSNDSWDSWDDGGSWDSWDSDW